MTTYVHWHEGLFLQPHHFQLMQRQFAQGRLEERALAWPYPYGLLEARLSREALANMQIVFDRLRLITPGGVLVDVGGVYGNCDLPILGIKQQFKAAGRPLTILLGVPLWQESRPNAVEGNGEHGDVRAKRIFRITDREVFDENTGTNARRLPVRQINARLLIEGEDTTDLDVLPILRVQPDTGARAGVPVPDETFIPPCMALAGSDALLVLVRDIVKHVETTRRLVAGKVKNDNVAMDNLRGRQFEEILRLRTLNRFAAILPSMFDVGHAIAPFQMYLALRELIGELAALLPERDRFDLAKFDHDNPGPIFHDLKRRVQELCRTGEEQTALAVPFKREASPARFVADLTERHVAAPNAYYLAVRTREDQRTVQELIEDGVRTKLMSWRDRGKKIFGIPLRRELNVPPQFPTEVGLHYFSLDRDSKPDQWDSVKEDRKIVLEGFVTRFDDFQCILYMTVPGEA